MSPASREEARIRRAVLLPGRTLPLVIESTDGAELLPYGESRREEVLAALGAHGAVLFRGFRPVTVAELERFIAAVTGELLDYTNRSTPRSQVSGRIYTSTDYPADQTIPQHNEMSYSREWPAYLCLCCLEAPTEGGETPISDSRRVYQRISPPVRERFLRDGVMYVRNYRDRIGLSWQEVFQTDDRAVVAEYCQAAGISAEWSARGGLRTVQVCQAAIAHPDSGEMVWFNQAHLFHVSSLEPRVRRSLVAMFGADLPRNACYGDGTPIEDAALDEVRAAYDAEEVAFRWQAGDVLMLDNLLAAHGRRPFSGARRVVVGMSSPRGAG